MAGADDLFTADFRGELSDVSLELERIDDLADGVSRSLSKAFHGAILDGKDLRSLLGDIGKSFADIALKAALKPVTNLAGNLVENLFTATNPALGGVQAFAKGGVIAAPSYFPMRGGTGLAGEAGPEAILPLARGSDGRLGVASAASAPISISVNVQASNAQSFIGAEAEMSAMLLRAVKRGRRAS
ncbi:phage tail tape measure protein [Mariluticola halotolerans]|uniref:phage tail tape measure protein n=1 Tax=Mariluticola halotolerans TaxID=2909283 RepID=UPI0026E308BB|nr:phage tail tape measure protein [Mariluticola halotolerans]UJQ95727.1 phage tail tape measure protein [Mariluticola halotolerans]